MYSREIRFGQTRTGNTAYETRHRERSDCILTQRSRWPRVHFEVTLEPPPPAKASSDHNIVHVRLSGRITLNRKAPKGRLFDQGRLFDRKVFVADETCRRRIVATNRFDSSSTIPVPYYLCILKTTSPNQRGSLPIIADNDEQGFCKLLQSIVGLKGKEN